jgi:simple sugar transport system permease protein
MDMSWYIDFILATIRAATPIIYCAIGVLIAERAGVIHMGVEGVMLAGALSAILGTVFSGSIWVGIVVAIITGLFLGVVLAVILVKLPTDQVVVGIAFNLAALGVTSYVYRLAGEKAREMIPMIDPLFLGLSPFEVFAFVLTILTWFFLFRTGAGLKLRSVGENAVAAEAAGINVIKVRSNALIIASVLSALGGAALTAGWVRVFTDNVTQGRGFIAIAAVYFGKWNPILAALATIIFGAGEALAFRSQAMGSSLSPYYYFMLPYVLTLLVVSLSGKMKGPADVGKIYLRR